MENVNLNSVLHNFFQSTNLINYDELTNFVNSRYAEVNLDEELLNIVKFGKDIDPKVLNNIFKYFLNNRNFSFAHSCVLSNDFFNFDLDLLWYLCDIFYIDNIESKKNYLLNKFICSEPKSSLGYVYKALAELRVGNVKNCQVTLAKATELFGFDGRVADTFLDICIQIKDLTPYIETRNRYIGNLTTIIDELLISAVYRQEVLALIIKYCTTANLKHYIPLIMDHFKPFEMTIDELWRLSDLLLANDCKEQCTWVRRHILTKNPIYAYDYLYIALSHYRLGYTGDSINILETAICKFGKIDYLWDNYLKFCAENKNFDRFFGLLNPENDNIENSIMNFFQSKIDESTILVDLIEYSKSKGFTELSVTMVNELIENATSTVKIWLLAEAFNNNGVSNISNALYDKLISLKLESCEDHLYKGLAYIRKSDFANAFNVFKTGIDKFDDHQVLDKVFSQTIAIHLGFAKFIDLVSNGGPILLSQSDLAYQFLDHVFNSDMLESFLLHFVDIEHFCANDILETLIDLYLSRIQTANLTINQRAYFLFLASYFGLQESFRNKLFESIHNSKNRFSPDEKIAGNIFKCVNSLTPPIVLNGVVSGKSILDSFINNCKIKFDPDSFTEPNNDLNKYWAPWISLFVTAELEKYPVAMQSFEEFAFKLWPKLDFVAPHLLNANPIKNKSKIKIGFTVLDAMPMMSGLAQGLDPALFETYFLRPGPGSNSDVANNWTNRVDHVIQYSDSDCYQAIDTIANAKLDIIISGPSMPSIFYPMMARVATLQMVLLEPNWLNGLSNLDYYISWGSAEPSSYSKFYPTSVAFLDHPPYWIEKPDQCAVSYTNSDSSNVRKNILGLDDKDVVYICANTPPKIHPEMDLIFKELLEKDPHSYIILLRGDFPASKILKNRLKVSLGDLYQRIIFLDTLKRDDAHKLLMASDCCLDSYPLCGMSSSFDGLMLGIPIVTLPANIPFGRWTAALYNYIGVDGLIASSKSDYVEIAYKVATDKEWKYKKSQEILFKSTKFVQSKASLDAFQNFILSAWKRKVQNQPNQDWIGNGWVERN